MRWDRKKRTLGHNRKSISYYAVSVWVFFSVVIKILLLTSQRHKISISLLQSWSEQSFPPQLAPEAASIFSANCIFHVVLSNYKTNSQRVIVAGKLGSSLPHHGLHPEKSTTLHDSWLFEGVVPSELCTHPKKVKEVVPLPLCFWTWVGMSWKFLSLWENQNLTLAITS